MEQVHFNQMVNASEMIKNSSIDQLRDEDNLTRIIQSWGLINDQAINFGYDNCRQPFGIFQQPEQLAPALIYLSYKGIKEYLEVGTFVGSSTTFISIYLSRFNKLHTLAIDLLNRYDDNLLRLANQYAYVEFHQGTSSDIKNYPCDLCFIDADHKYESVKQDYENVGKTAEICMFHDINDEGTVKDRDGSGTVKFWNEIKRPESIEFTKHPLGLNVMGIGIL